MARRSLTDWNSMVGKLRVAFVSALLGAPLAVSAQADEPDAAEEPDETAAAEGDSNVKGRSVTARTLGGRQFWADVEFFREWRIQQNVLTGHYRLLDGDDCRCASGTREVCQQKLADIRTERKLPPMSGEVVILIHGLVRSSKSMRGLQRHLQEEQPDWQTFSFGYPSTRVDIARAAEYLHSVIESLEGVERIHFVVHSMGGLVVRAWLAEHHDPRVGRMVMIATPNQGAHLADRFEKNPIYRVVFGPAGRQLTRTEDGFIAKLPTPEFEFGIIAGGRKETGYNPLIPGDNDGTVSVASTRLPGATDFIVIEHLHTFLVSAPETAGYAAHFLQHGRFREDGDPQPIPREDPPGRAKATDHP